MGCIPAAPVGRGVRGHPAGDAAGVLPPAAVAPQRAKASRAALLALPQPRAGGQLFKLPHPLCGDRFSGLVTTLSRVKLNSLLMMKNAFICAKLIFYNKFALRLENKINKIKH